jgi:N-acetylglucosaminyl-diphospho-decaprenol L-rhamnosyltransferase
MSKEIAIVIVTFKSAHIIEDTLRPIVNNGFDITIVDNNSEDDLELVINEHFNSCEINLIKLDKNIGFAGANNVVLRKLKSKYTLLLNPDAIIRKKDIDLLVSYCDADEKVALSGAFDTKVLNPSSIDIETAIDEYIKTVKIFNDNNDFIETNFICGGYMLLKMSVFRKIGFFDERFFLYGEDEELCDRVIQNQYKIIMVKKALVYHNQHSSTKVNNVKEKYFLLFKRYYHMGWSRTYLKQIRGKPLTKIVFSLIIQFISSVFYIFCFQPEKAVMRIGRSIGGLKCWFIK